MLKSMNYTVGTWQTFPNRALMDIIILLSQKTEHKLKMKLQLFIHSTVNQGFFKLV